MELKNTYKSKILERKLPPDVFFASIDNHTEQTDTLSKTIHPRFVQFYFCVKGKVTFHFSPEYHKILEEGNSFLIFQPDKDLPIEISLSAHSKLEIVVMSITELHDLFSSEVFNDFVMDTQTKVYEAHPISNEMRYVLSQMEQVNITDTLSTIYWRTKISELLLLYFSQKMEAENSCPYMEHESMARQIKAAKDFLLENISNPPKINELAKEVEMSEYKLKEGFKKIYGMNISQYITQHRMQMGKEELEKKNKKVKVIAQELGYENPSHFIDAFKRQYGITPKQYEKTLI